MSCLKYFVFILQVIGPGGRIPYILPREALLREPPPRYTSQPDINQFSIVNPGFRDDDGNVRYSGLDFEVPVPNSGEMMGLAPPVYRSNPNMCNVSMNSIDTEPPPRYTSRQEVDQVPRRESSLCSNSTQRNYGLQQEQFTELPILQDVLEQGATLRNSQHFDAAEYQNARLKMLERLQASSQVELEDRVVTRDSSKESLDQIAVVQIHKESTPDSYATKPVQSSSRLRQNEVVNLSYKETSSTDSLDSADFHAMSTSSLYDFTKKRNEVIPSNLDLSQSNTNCLAGVDSSNDTSLGSEKCLDSSYAIFKIPSPPLDTTQYQIKKAKSLSSDLDQDYSVRSGDLLPSKSQSTADVTEKRLSRKPISRSMPQLNSMKFTLHGSSESIASCQC